MPSAAAAHEAYRSRRRFGNLDGLRFICISMVLWHHNAPLWEEDLMLATRGFLGVDFFFVLSGFLITTLLLRERAERGEFSMRNFYLRRILRIVPVYFFVVTAVASYYILVQGQTDLLRLLPFYYLFLSNFLTEHIPLLTITWSLSVEEQYYMLWPLILLVLPPRLLVPVCLALIALNVALALDLFGIDPVAAGPLLFTLPNATYAPIIMGSLAAVILHHRRGFDAAFAAAGWPGAAVAGFAVLVAVLQFGPGNLIGLPNLAVHTMMTFILVALVVREETAITPFLAHPLVARIGVVSYGMYLYHLIALDIVNRTGRILGIEPSTWTVLGLYFVLSWLIAELSFRTLEAWFQRYRPKS